MNADAAFGKGDTHPVCEDFALASSITNPERGLEPFVVVADGCSSSPSVDTGARILALTVKNLIEVRRFDFSDPQHFKIAAMLAGEYIRQLGLPQQSLDATLGIITRREGESTVSFYGDGVFVAGADNKLYIREIKFAANYPVYVSYELNPERKARLEAVEGNHKTITTYVVEDGKLTDQYSEPGNTQSNLERWMISDEIPYNWLAVCTDGLSDFCTDNRKTKIPVWQVAAELFNMKVLKGEFVQRRLKGFFTQATAKQWEHLDDLGVGVLTIK
jgi:hypothetical protein